MEFFFGCVVSNFHLGLPMYQYLGRLCFTSCELAGSICERIDGRERKSCVVFDSAYCLEALDEVEGRRRRGEGL